LDRNRKRLNKRGLRDATDFDAPAFAAALRAPKSETESYQESRGIKNR
jgi:hypothetical protein